VTYDDRGAAALPKLYGAPAYARPRVAVVSAYERPFDPDDQPLACAVVDDDGPSLDQPASGPSARVDIEAVATSPAPHPSGPMAVAGGESEFESHFAAEREADGRPAPDDPSLVTRLGGLFRVRNRGAS
jgi:hypothetical protein